MEEQPLDTSKEKMPVDDDIEQNEEGKAQGNHKPSDNAKDLRSSQWSHALLTSFPLLLILLAIVVGVIVPATMGEPSGGEASKSLDSSGHSGGGLASKDAAPAQDGRVILPSHVVPFRYEIFLTPDLEAYNFTGHVDIDFVVDPNKLNEDNNREIILNANSLEFISAEYSLLPPGDDDGAPVVVPAIDMIVNDTDTTVRLVFAQPIPNTAQNISLSIDYTGPIRGDMTGFYHSQYQDIEGNLSTMASTQFEPIGARRAVPCVDEPAVKATFVVHMTVLSHLEVLANMPTSSVVSLDDGMHRTFSFLETPVMPSYLLAFVVGEFDSVQGRTKDGGVMVKVNTPPGQSDKAEYALKTALAVLDLYNDFFQVPFPLPKVDMVAIPEFAQGAMENWGLVTYRVTELLVDPLTASASQLQRVAVVVCHELAHQWFGNLVTMEWWNDLWLNEGFAAWAQTWSTDKLYPQYQMWEQFAQSTLSSALNADATRNSHAIQVPIKRAEEVDQVFDSISYDKGASVIHMLQGVIGMESFQEGLVEYMKKYAYSNTVTEDLWTAFGEASGQAVDEIMKSWTEQMGYPLLMIEGEDWQAGQVDLHLRQQWYLVDGNLTADDEGKLWHIPIMTTTDAGISMEKHWMRDKAAKISIPAAVNGWVKLNAEQKVPMRVLYTQEMLKRLSGAVQDGSMSDPSDRFGLLDDNYSLMKSGHVAPEIFVGLLSSYKGEDNYVVWGAISTALNGLHDAVSVDPEMLRRANEFGRGFAMALLDKIGWDPRPTDGHLATMQRSILVQLLLKFAYDDPAVQEEVSARVRAFLEDPSNTTILSADIRVPVFRIYLLNGNATEFEELKSLYSTAGDEKLRLDVVSSLGYVDDPELKLEAMEMIFTGDVKQQDAAYPFAGVAGSGMEGRKIAWQFLQENFERIVEMIGTGPVLGQLIRAARDNTLERAREVEAFFKARPVPEQERTIQKLLDSIRVSASLSELVRTSKLAQMECWSCGSEGEE